MYSVFFLSRFFSPIFCFAISRRDPNVFCPGWLGRNRPRKKSKATKSRQIHTHTKYRYIYVSFAIWNSLRLDNTFHLCGRVRAIYKFFFRSAVATWHDDLLDEKRPKKKMRVLQFNAANLILEKSNTLVNFYKTNRTKRNRKWDRNSINAHSFTRVQSTLKEEQRIASNS